MRFASLQWSKTYYCDCERDLAPDPAGELTALPKPSSCFQLGEEGEGKWKGKVESADSGGVGRGGEVSWNKVADCLRPALAKYNKRYQTKYTV